MFVYIRLSVSVTIIGHSKLDNHQPNHEYTLTFYFKRYQYNQTRKTGAILHLDHTIGEYTAMTKIRGVTFKSLPLFGTKGDLKNLDDLKVQMELGPLL
jgi:hypothetical protein